MGVSRFTPAIVATTPAQAKIEAVASLTMKAYERASMLTLTPEEAALLEAEFPDEAFKQGAGGNPDLIYIEHAHLRDRLNKVFGPGQWAIVPRSRWAEEFKTAKGEAATRVYVEAMLMVRGGFVSEAIGDMVYYPHNATQNYGDAVEGAKSACLRRCAKELGIGLQAWKKDFCIGWKQRNAGGRAPVSQPKTTAPVQKPAAAKSFEEVVDGEKPQKSWVTVEVHYGKNKGTKLGVLNPKSLRWYCENFEVSETYEGKDGTTKKKSPENLAKDQAFRDALDEAQETLSDE